jgi:hypothetical protein
MTGRSTIFGDHPLDGKITIAGETLSTPYHVMDGAMLLIGGTAEANVASELLLPVDLVPVIDSQGRALAAIWICDFTKANLGPHHELQISLFAAPRPVAPVPASPYAVLRTLVTASPARMVCHGLWNSTERVARYNREYLCLDANISHSEITTGKTRINFQFPSEDGHLIADGEFRIGQRQSVRTFWQIMRHVGFSNMLAAMSKPYLTVPVIGTGGPSSDPVVICQTHSFSEKQSIRHFGADDRLTIRHPVYRRLGLQPEFVQHLQRIGFVFGRPAPWSDRNDPE